MLEKELANASKMAEQANAKVLQLKKKLLSETEKAHAKAKRELTATRKKHSTVNARLKKAKSALRGKKNPANQDKVESLMSQLEHLGESLAAISKAAYESAEKLLPLKADLVLEERMTKAAEKAAAAVEKAARKKSAEKAKARAKKAKAAAKKRRAAARLKAAA